MPIVLLSIDIHLAYRIMDLIWPNGYYGLAIYSWLMGVFGNTFKKLQPCKVGGVPGSSLASLESWRFLVTHHEMNNLGIFIEEETQFSQFVFCFFSSSQYSVQVLNGWPLLKNDIKHNPNESL